MSYPSLFKQDPFEFIINELYKDKEVLISNDGVNWEEGVFVKQVNPHFVCWTNAKTLDDAAKQPHTSLFNYMKPKQ